MAKLESVGAVMRRMFGDFIRGPEYRYIIVKSDGSVTLLERYQKGAIPLRKIENWQPKPVLPRDFLD